MRAIDNYSFLKQWALVVAASNGLINRLEPEDQLLDKVDRAIGAEGVNTQDVVTLNVWLGTLSVSDFDTLTDGADDEMDAIQDRSPKREDGKGHVTDLLEDIYSEMAELE